MSSFELHVCDSNYFNCQNQKRTITKNFRCQHEIPIGFLIKCFELLLETSQHARFCNLHINITEIMEMSHFLHRDLKTHLYVPNNHRIAVSVEKILPLRVPAQDQRLSPLRSGKGCIDVLYDRIVDYSQSQSSHPLCQKQQFTLIIITLVITAL